MLHSSTCLTANDTTEHVLYWSHAWDSEVKSMFGPKTLLGSIGKYLEFTCEERSSHSDLV